MYHDNQKYNRHHGGATFDINQYLTASLDGSAIGNKNGNDGYFGLPQSIMTTLNIAYTF